MYHRIYACIDMAANKTLSGHSSQHDYAPKKVFSGLGSAKSNGCRFLSTYRPINGHGCTETDRQ